jgi:hypothetical protein
VLAVREQVDVAVSYDVERLDAAEVVAERSGALVPKPWYWQVVAAQAGSARQKEQRSVARPIEATPLVQQRQVVMVVASAAVASKRLMICESPCG